MPTFTLIAGGLTLLAVWLLIAWAYTRMFGLIGFWLMPSPEMVANGLTAIGHGIGAVLEGLGELLAGIFSALSE